MSWAEFMGPRNADGKNPKNRILVYIRSNEWWQVAGKKWARNGLGILAIMGDLTILVNPAEGG